jgi:hypothetical protein
MTLFYHSSSAKTCNLEQTHVFPPALTLLVLPTGGTASTPSPSYHTSRLSFIVHKPFLPPSFKVFAGAGTHGKKDLAPEVEGPEVAALKFSGGVRNLTIQVELGSSSMEGTKNKTVTVQRDGWGREYGFLLPGQSGLKVLWKGTKTAVGNAKQEVARSSSQPGSKGDKEAKEPSRHSAGHLKLVAASATDSESDKAPVKGVFENKTHPSILGHVYLYVPTSASGEPETATGLDEGAGLEEVLFSLLGIVLSEKLLYRGWLAGLGKSAAKES